MAKQSINISEEAGIRFLHFSQDWIQGAMRIQRPNALELAYTREMMAGLLFREPPWPRTALLVGLGAGSLAKFIYHHFPETVIDVIEIDPQVEIVARLHFKLPDDPRRLRIHIGDGAEFMLGGGGHYDCILVDGFDHNGRPGPLDTLPFYQACRARLSENGLLSVNLLSRRRGFAASKERITTAFDDKALVFPSCESGNTIAFARDQMAVDIELEELQARAQHLRTATGLNLLPTLPRLQSAEKLKGNRLQF